MFRQQSNRTGKVLDGDMHVSVVWDNRSRTAEKPRASAASNFHTHHSHAPVFRTATEQFCFGFRGKIRILFMADV